MLWNVMKRFMVVKSLMMWILVTMCLVSTWFPNALATMYIYMLVYHKLSCYQIIIVNQMINMLANHIGYFYTLPLAYYTSLTIKNVTTIYDTGLFQALACPIPAMVTTQKWHIPKHIALYVDMENIKTKINHLPYIPRHIPYKSQLRLDHTFKKSSIDLFFHQFRYFLVFWRSMPNYQW